MNESSMGKYTNDNSTLTLNPPPNLKSLFNHMNQLKAESNKKNPERFINCRNLDIDEIQKMKVKPNWLSSFQINSCSSNKKFEDLEYLIKATNKTFDAIKISESRILKDSNFSKNINIYKYSVKFTPISYKLRQEFCVYKSSKLQSTFIEIIHPKKTKYHHWLHI